MFAVTRCDQENTDFAKTLEALKAEVGTKICPVVVPYYEGGAVKAYANLATGKAYEYKTARQAKPPSPRAQPSAKCAMYSMRQ